MTAPRGCFLPSLSRRQRACHPERRRREGSAYSSPRNLWHLRDTPSPPSTGNLRNPPGVATNSFVLSEALNAEACSDKRGARDSARVVAARSEHRAPCPRVGRPRQAGRLHDRAQAAADHGREGLGEAGCIGAIARLRRGGVPRGHSATPGPRPGAARVRRLDAGARAPRLALRSRHGAGARSDPQVARREKGRTYMIMTQALGWALVDSLWQDALAAAGLAALLALVPVRAARIGYAFATLTLALMLALPLATAVRLSGTSPQISDVVTATSPVTAAAPVAHRIRAA